MQRFFLILSFIPGLLLGNPTGEQVRAGSVAAGREKTTLTITQQTDQAIIEWKDFSIQAGEMTRFIQPGSSSSVLNRVMGDQVSSIYGTLQANGNVFLLNRNGILVGPGGVINANSFVASTLEMTDEMFLNGKAFHFKNGSDGKIINQGSINALGKEIIIIAKEIENEGTLAANHGSVLLTQVCRGRFLKSFKISKLKISYFFVTHSFSIGYGF